jgi:mannose-1-phosphate guanylyltransferase/mannose-6-phosphate isomerase
MSRFREGIVEYSGLPSLSIDYGLLEKSKKVAVVPLKAAWTDLGTFRAWYDHKPHDASGNSGHAELLDSSGNFVYAPGKCAALIGVSDLVLVDTGDALLACHMDSTERVSELVKQFKERGHTITDYHLQLHRPWGSYTELEKSRFFRIKRVTVKPGKKLSLQMHHHRSEHWIVVSGMADVILGDRTIHLRQGESTFVPAATRHRLANTGKIPLEVIEVQIGEYLEEDDITRFSDDYNRV